MEPIKSPYSFGVKTFQEEVEALTKKHGFTQFFILYGEPNIGNSTSFTGGSNVISESMVGALEKCIEDMHRYLENET